MSKDQKSGGKSKGASISSKKGVVIERRRNRTVNQDVAASHPKWYMTEKGMLQRNVLGNLHVIQRGGGNKWESVRFSPAMATIPLSADTLDSLASD
jgi:hypothetical protein